MQETLESLQKRREELVGELARISAELSDVKLWETLGDGKTEYPHNTLPPEEEFAMGCKAYYLSRKKDAS